MNIFKSIMGALVIPVYACGQVDGFRFDIMGHLMVPSMQKIQAALGTLTLQADGVDGRGIYIYGEAWDFGEVIESHHDLHFWVHVCHQNW